MSRAGPLHVEFGLLVAIQVVGMTALLVSVLVGCDDRPRQWDAFIYPDFEGSERYETIAGFRTFEACQAAAMNRMRQLPTPEKASYECGYMCRFDPQMQLNVCKETRD